MNSGINNLYGFEEFRFDAETKTLWRSDEMISLPPKASEVLRLLIENEGRLVTKQEILNTVWADTFVEEGVLTQSIYLLRQTLGAERKFIKTIARRGYCFGVPVQVLNKNEIQMSVGRNTKNGLTGQKDSVLSAQSFEDLSVSVEGDPAETGSSAQKKFSTQTKKREPTGLSFAFRNTAFAAVGILFLLTVLFGLGFWVYQFFKRGAPNIEAARIAPIEQLRFQRLTDIGDVIFPTISPNGELLAFVRHEEDVESVWVKQIATDGEIRILPPSNKGYASLTFSPDGQYLYFREAARSSAIFQTTVLGAAPKKVAENVWGDFSVSPDGRRLAFVRRDGEKNSDLLILANIDGSGERELTARKAPLDYRGPPAFSPDGTKLAVAAGIQSQLFPKLFLIDVSTGKESELQIPRWRSIPRALWMPNGKNLIVSAREVNEPSSQIWMLSPFTGEVRRLTNDLEGYFWLSLSADGQKLVTRQQRIVSHLWVLPGGDLKKAQQLTFGSRSLDGYAGLAWTPDGKIIFTSFSDNVTDLYSINKDGENKLQLTSNAGQDNTNPSVSSDGKYVVFLSNRTGTTQIWRMDTDGRNQKQLTFSQETTERKISPVFSPDGREVFFIKRGTASDGIWKISVDGGTPVPVSSGNTIEADSFLSVSPDGKWLAYRHISRQTKSDGETPTTRIGVIPTDANAEPKIFDLPVRRPFVQWSPDSSTFDYSAGLFNTSSLVRQPFGAGEERKIIDFPDRLFYFSWSNAGRYLAVSRGRQQGDAILITNLP